MEPPPLELRSSIWICVKWVWAHKKRFRSSSFLFVRGHCLVNCFIDHRAPAVSHSPRNNSIEFHLFLFVLFYFEEKSHPSPIINRIGIGIRVILSFYRKLIHRQARERVSASSANTFSRAIDRILWPTKWLPVCTHQLDVNRVYAWLESIKCVMIRDEEDEVENKKKRDSWNVNNDNCRQTLNEFTERE